MDFRIYYYDGYAILKKLPAKFHKAKSLDEAEGKVKELHDKGRHLRNQLVIIDYTLYPGGVHRNSQIVKIINPKPYYGRK